MSEYESYIHYGRLVVLLQFILIPIYFYLLSFIFVGGVIWFLKTPDLVFLSDFIVYGIGPLVMAVPFFFWTYGKKYQIGDAYETFGREVWRLPTTIKAFYGFNFLLGIIFLFPLLVPVVSLFGGYFIAVYLFGWREEDKKISNQRKTRLLTLLYFPLPLLVVIGFYFGYDLLGTQSGIFSFFIQLIEYWTSQVDLLYTSALILADSATIGGAIYLIYEGAQQVDREVEIPEILITLISLVCFIILETLFLFFSDSFEGFLVWIHIVVVILGVLLLIIRYWKGLLTSRDTSIIGWLTLLIFQLVNFATGALETISRSSAIFIAFAIFLFLFWVAYQRAGKRY
ncbi:hypothetical protein CEE45_05680 [Candidatus Heimdallarchaeota archaeon B3_Heim]|nr:MAG: hypothetical protein CEE45_05680 [Candidatus Heimdallarchaeota archaeon B3_Heim]